MNSGIDIIAMRSPTLSAMSWNNSVPNLLICFAASVSWTSPRAATSSSVSLPLPFNEWYHFAMSGWASSHFEET